MTIHLKEATAYTYDVPFLKEIQPYAHQVVQSQMIKEAVTSNKPTIIWNQAMTGAGKTLANYSLLTHMPKIRALGMYPVNELIKDQYQSVKDSVELGKWDEVAIWTAEEMRGERKPGESKVDQIRRMTSSFYRSIFTNPDHLMLISQERFFSYKKGDVPELLYRLADYHLQIFDEFHLYDIAQVNFLAQWMALITSLFPSRGYAFVLSSATPRVEFFQLAKRMGIQIRNVQEEVDRWLEEERPRVYEERVYLEPLSLDLCSTNLHRWNTSERILEQWEEQVEYLRKWPTAKGIIILDSIHEAQMLAHTLRQKGYDVGEVHGLSDRTNSRIALAKPITVATATIEVGVDFKGDIHKDFLIFESRNAGSFMQRLGRVGRGSRRLPEPPIKVWAHVPSHVKECIDMDEWSEMTRQDLKRVVMDSYQRYQDFYPFLEKVGGMNLVHGYYLAKRHQLETANNPILESLKTIVEKMYGLGFEEQNRQYQTWKKLRMIEPILSFRGQNSLENQVLHPDQEERLDTFYPDIWFWDETEPKMPIKKYDFRHVLSRKRVRFEPKEVFLAKAKGFISAEEWSDWKKKFENDRVLGYATVMGIRDKPAKLYWKLPPNAHLYTEKVVRMKRLQLLSDDPGLNEQLSDLFSNPASTSWIVTILKISTGEANDRLKLPPMFRLHTAQTVQKADWCIAFNVDAFKLWSVWSQESVVY
ncbi:type I-D CRISPR-associated helicase Cas3' [Marininema halotolerans]|uniref:CRISPR-associated helicase Cas3, subtype CYANO n=1 Tax=Marininema halotolerans TaxID=1155944 RepID=A0A1I6SDV3_9BACL|nr:type I-D CRISPR-associated helicase Cas3' [Marininema halotolerans]SFS75119.1 CRISPR-associated helicase Cas3, subtype CYANO [Marininema halotolerans]